MPGPFRRAAEDVQSPYVLTDRSFLKYKIPRDLIIAELKVIESAGGKKSGGGFNRFTGRQA
jgi:hypothetical protein